MCFRRLRQSLYCLLHFKQRSLSLHCFHILGGSPSQKSRRSLAETRSEFHVSETTQDKMDNVLNHYIDFDVLPIKPDFFHRINLISFPIFLSPFHAYIYIYIYIYIYTQNEKTVVVYNITNTFVSTNKISLVIDYNFEMLKPECIKNFRNKRGTIKKYVM